MKASTTLLFTVFLALSATATAKWVQAPFIRGDANRDSRIDITDVIALVNYMYTGMDYYQVDENCLGAADANGDDALDITDLIYLLKHLFIGGKPPPAPFPLEGLGPVDAVLGCGAEVIVLPPME